MMLFIKQYWKVILIAVLLLGSNYLTKEYVSRGYESTIAEMNVDGLKQTLEMQKLELDKQKQTIKSLQEVNNNAKQRTDKINSDLIAANKSLELFKQKLRSMSSSREGGDSTTSIRSAANAATDKLVLSQLLEHCAERYKRMAETADRSRAAGLSCEEQYQSIREVFNGKEK